MCSSKNWKATGDKARLAKRLVRKQRALLLGREGMVSLIESKIGPKLGDDGPSAQLRRFYAARYQALDRFDRVWYQMRFHDHPHDWLSYFCWSLLHAAIINTRGAWCIAHQEKVPIRDFVANLVAVYVRSRGP